MAGEYDYNGTIKTVSDEDKPSVTKSYQTYYDLYKKSQADTDTKEQQDSEASAPFVQPNPYLFTDEAKNQAQAIYNPLIEGAQTQKEKIDAAADLQIEGIKEMVPYVTRQFESYQAKAGLSTGTQGRMANELVLDIAQTVGSVYAAAEMQKYDVDSTISAYQSAMAQGEFQLATQLYNESLSRAQFMSDYLDMPFIQPEVQYVYDQMIVAQKIMDDPKASSTEKARAEQNLSALEGQLKAQGFSGEIGQGLQTYRQKTDELNALYEEVVNLYNQSSFDVQYASVLETNQAWLAINNGTMTFEEALVAYPGADYMKILEMQKENADKTFDFSQLMPENTQQ